MSSRAGAARRLGRALRLAPAVAPVAVLSLSALAFGVAASLGVGAALGASTRRGPSLDAYRTLFARPGFWTSYWFSVSRAALATTLAVSGALLIGFRWSSSGGRRRAVRRWLVQVNLSVPHLVWAVALVATFSASGWLARVATAVGLIDRPAQFPTLVNDRWGIGIVGHLVSKELPFVLLTLLPFSGPATAGQLDQAAVLGAAPAERFRHVYLPAVAPAAVPAGLATFAFALGAYEPAAVLGVQRPRALAVVALERFRGTDPASRAEAFAISSVLLATAMTAAVAAWWATRRRRPGTAGRS